MTSWYSQQKEKWLLKVRELEETNKTLLDNNVKLAAENTRLSAMTDAQQSKILTLEKEKTECKQKCEIIIKQKDTTILEKERYIAGLHNTIWNLKNSFECKIYRFIEIPKGFRLEFDFHDKRDG